MSRAEEFFLPVLADAVLSALKPRNVRERLRARWLGGWTVVQVMERLDAGDWAFDGPVDPSGGELADRRLAEAVRAELLALAAAGRVCRGATTMGATLRSKGERKIIVDVFRLA